MCPSMPFTMCSAFCSQINLKLHSKCVKIDLLEWKDPMKIRPNKSAQTFFMKMVNTTKLCKPCNLTALRRMNSSIPWQIRKPWELDTRTIWTRAAFSIRKRTSTRLLSLSRVLCNISISWTSWHLPINKTMEQSCCTIWHWPTSTLVTQTVP